MLVACLTGAAAFGLALFLLSRNFVKFITSKKSLSVKGKKGVVKSATMRRSLFMREWKLFSSSPAYVMNSAFGVIFLIAVPIFAIVKASALRGAAQAFAAYFPNASGVGIAAMVLIFTSGMCCITAPAISMEGKRIYVLRSLPVPTMDIFIAKLLVHLAVVLPGALFMNITLAVVLRADVMSWIFMILLPVAHALFTACIGLCFNVTFPVLDWTDEMTAVKSGVSVLISVFGAMILNLLLCGAYFLIVQLFRDGVYLLLLTLLYSVGAAIMLSWLKAKGVKKFEKLS